MSIAFESGGGSGIERPGFAHGMSCISIFDSPKAGVFSDDRRFPAAVEDREEGLDSCSSSSIGRNSDVSEGSSEGEDSGETEVQSSYKGPLESMDALEDVLVVRKGISKFYNGKSKSFTSLADASMSSCAKDLAKPENAYAKKRRNLLAHSNFFDKSRNGGGISKRPFNSSRSSFSLAVCMSSSDGSSNNCNESISSAGGSGNLCASHSPSPSLPPLHPQGKKSPNNGGATPPSSSSPSPPSQQKFPTWRSFSLSDLQGMDSATPSIKGLADNNKREKER